MGYYFENRYNEILYIRSEDEAKRYTDDNPIEIINNEEIILDLNGFSSTDEKLSGNINEEFTDVDYGDEGVIDSFFNELFDNNIVIENDGGIVRNSIRQITIDFKDGTDLVTIVQPTPYKKDWMKVKHKFSFKKDYSDTEGKIDDIEIKISLFYKKETTDLLVPFCIKHSSSRIQGIELRLVDAKLSNDKKISYIFEDKNTNQIFLASYQGKL